MKVTEAPLTGLGKATPRGVARRPLQRDKAKAVDRLALAAAKAKSETCFWVTRRIDPKVRTIRCTRDLGIILGDRRRNASFACKRGSSVRAAFET
jgi:hypothetical protein